jgi:hypothetical protein
MWGLWPTDCTEASFSGILVISLSHVSPSTPLFPVQCCFHFDVKTRNTEFWWMNLLEMLAFQKPGCKCDYNLLFCLWETVSVMLIRTSSDYVSVMVFVVSVSPNFLLLERWFRLLLGLPEIWPWLGVIDWDFLWICMVCPDINWHIIPGLN